MSSGSPRGTNSQIKSKGSTFRKIKRYLEAQAQEQSHSALFLSPRAPRTGQEADTTDSTILQPQGHYTPTQHTLDYTQRSLSAMTASSASGTGTLQQIRRHQYASDNILQSYDVLVPARASTTQTGVWVVYIHGGYFRDPKVDSTSLKPAISIIEDSAGHEQLRSQIGGYASLNYRLSPHSGHPQDPSSTPSYTLNNARWPDHVNDVMNALRHLQDHYPASRDYVLLGHSVGATLAFMAVLRAAEAKVALPRGVVGVSGIYDFPGIHKTNPEYVSLTSNAMTPDQYREASPALHSKDEYEQRWEVEGQATSAGLVESRKVVVLAHSRDDGLVVWGQMEEMKSTLAESKMVQTSVLELYGKHDDIWKGGVELVRAIEKVIEVL